MAEARDAALNLTGATLSYDVRSGDSPTAVSLHGPGQSRANEDTAGVSGLAAHLQRRTPDRAQALDAVAESGW